MEPLRWGVLGVSTMVGRLAVLPALASSPAAELVAIASRDPERARSEAASFQAPKSYGSYAQLVADAAVEAVYIPLPNSLHHDWTIACLEAGKHVLCEKPLACSAQEAREMQAAAARAGKLLLEAHMTSFHARYNAVMKLAEDGGLGGLRHIHSQFTFTNSDPKNHRWFPEMGGGALLDVGVYCLDPILRLAGHPSALSGRAVAAGSGVDATFSGWLEFGHGMTASFLTSFELAEAQRLELHGTQASLVMERAFTAGVSDQYYTTVSSDGTVLRLATAANDSYLAMVEHFAAAVRGEEQLRRGPHASGQSLEVIDSLRAIADLK